jgi:hypothetical protein
MPSVASHQATPCDSEAAATTRWSSAVAAPVDTTVFLYGADLAKQMELGMEPGNSLHPWNWVVFVVGKMVGALIVSAVIRRREDAGLISPREA